MKNRTILILEGANKTGKDTIARMIKEKTNYSMPVIIRWQLSAIVYDNLYNRMTSKSNDFDTLKYLNCNFNVLICLLTASSEQIIQRLIAHNEKFCKHFVNKELRLFEKYFYKLQKYIVSHSLQNIKLIKYDTSKSSASEIVDNICNLLKYFVR